MRQLLLLPLTVPLVSAGLIGWPISLYWPPLKTSTSKHIASSSTRVLSASSSTLKTSAIKTSSSKLGSSTFKSTTMVTSRSTTTVTSSTRTTSPATSRPLSASSQPASPSLSCPGIVTTTLVAVIDLLPVTTTVTTVTTTFLMGDNPPYQCPSPPCPYVITVFTDNGLTSTVDGGTYTISPVSTVIVPTPAGFTPVLSGLPSAAFDYSYQYSQPTSSPTPAKRAVLNHKQRRADCGSSTTTVYSTSTPPPPTYTVTVTKTTSLILFPIEGTLVPVESYTTGIPQSSTTYTTITNVKELTFSTATTTLAGPATSTTTYYAACATNNQANERHNEDASYYAITGVVGAQPVAVQNTTRPYDCCVQAINANAAAWIWALEGATSCNIFPGTDCQASAAQYTAYAQLYNPYTKVLGNGVCGQWTQLNRDDNPYEVEVITTTAT